MAIQFYCTRCGQPIEVDDVHAGQTAACPYCQSMVRVPAESTYRAGESAAARPLPESTADAEPASGPLPPGTDFIPPPPVALPGTPPPDPRLRLARKLGHWSLACAIIGVVLLLGAMIYGAVLGFDAARAGRSTDFRKMEELLQSKPGAMAVNTVGSCGSMVFALAGLGLGIASVAQSRRENWPGWTGLIGSGAMLLCFFGLTLVYVVMMSAGTAGAG